MTVTITITDPTADESRAVRAYLTALHNTAVDFSQVTEAVEEHAEWIGQQTRELIKGMATTEPLVLDPADLNLSEITYPNPAGAPDFDSAGYPWDERIHASSRATVADGTWRKKRGVSDELVASVEAELVRTGVEQVDAANEAIAEAAGITDAVTVEVPLREQSAPEAPSAPVEERKTFVIPDGHEAVRDAEGKATGETVPVPPPPAATPNPFLAVMSRIGKSKLDKAKKDELLTAAGALDEKGNPSILVLNKRPELIDGFVALLDSEGV